MTETTPLEPQPTEPVPETTLHAPTEETDRLVLAGRLADLAEQHPGHHFVLVGEHD